MCMLKNLTSAKDCGTERGATKIPRYARLHVSMLVAVLTAACAGNEKAPQASASPKIAVDVTRYSELPLSEYQTAVMNEATKLSLACRLFRYLYGRWPQDLDEIRSRTEGLDYGVFLGKAKITPLPDDAESIEIFDGTNYRAVKAVPVDFDLSPEDKAKAQAPGYKIGM